MHISIVTPALIALSIAAGSAVAAESAVTAGMDCYQIGYRYSTCALASAAGLPCPASWDFAVPQRCHGTSKLKQGLDEGSADFYVKAKKVMGK